MRSRSALPTGSRISTTCCPTRSARRSCAAMRRRRAMHASRSTVRSAARRERISRTAGWAKSLAVSSRVGTLRAFTPVFAGYGTIDFAHAESASAAPLPTLHALLLRRRRRQEQDLVLGRQRHHLVGFLLLHAVDRPEQIVELARRRHPEQAFDRLVGLVEQAMRDAHRQPQQIARIGDEILAVEPGVEPALVMPLVSGCIEGPPLLGGNGLFNPAWTPFKTSPWGQAQPTCEQRKRAQ